MDTQTRYLWAAVALFVLLGGLFTWSVIYRRANTFAVGSQGIQAPDDFAPPTLPPVRASDPRLGSKKPDALEVVEFADYRCLHCRAMAPDLFALLSDPTRNVRLVWREAPTQDQSREALLPFAAARCAAGQGKFDAMHPAIYRLSDPREAALVEAARAASLDIPRFQACLADARVLDAIRRDQQEALANHIASAPTLFVRGQPFVGQLERAQLEAVLR